MVIETPSILTVSMSTFLLGYYTVVLQDIIIGGKRIKGTQCFLCITSYNHMLIYNYFKIRSVI